MSLINELLRSCNLSWLRYISVTILICSMFMGLVRWIKLFLKNKKYKIRTETLKELRQLVRDHRGTTHVIVRVQIARLNVFGVNAFTVSLPHPIIGWSQPLHRCIYTRHDMPNGEYACYEDTDFLVLVRIRDGTLSSMDFPLRVEKPKYQEPNLLFAPPTKLFD